MLTFIVLNLRSTIAKYNVGFFPPSETRESTFAGLLLEAVGWHRTRVSVTIHQFYGISYHRARQALGKKSWKLWKVPRVVAVVRELPWYWKWDPVCLHERFVLTEKSPFCVLWKIKTYSKDLLQIFNVLSTKKEDDGSTSLRRTKEWEKKRRKSELNQVGFPEIYRCVRRVKCSGFDVLFGDKRKVFLATLHVTGYTSSFFSRESSAIADLAIGLELRLLFIIYINCSQLIWLRRIRKIVWRMLWSTFSIEDDS